MAMSTQKTIMPTSGKTKKQTAESLDFFDRLGGYSPSEQSQFPESFFPEKLARQPKPPQRKEFTVFSFQEHYEESEIKRQIKELTEMIKREVEVIKRGNKDLLAEVRDIEKITLSTLPEKPGIYHVRFLEVILSILKALRAKVGESKTWLEAMKSKRKKRGSLFMSLSKKKGTQYSLSQELQTARSVQ